MCESKQQSKNHSSPWFKRWGLWLVLLIVINVSCIFLIVDGTLDSLFDKMEMTEPVTSGMTGEEVTTEENTEAVESTEAKPTVRYPEGAVIIDGNDNLEEFYFRNWYLSFFFIPEELGNACSTSVKIPKMADAEGSRSSFVDLCFQKEDQEYQYKGYSLQWNESLLFGKTAWITDIYTLCTRPSLEKMDEEEDSFGKYLMQISANLNQEIYPAGENLSVGSLWNGILEEVGFRWMAENGELYGSIKGDVYIMSDSPRECWICVDGMMPLKLTSPPGMKCITEQRLPYILDAEFEEEKDRALAKLSFDLTVEPRE